MPKKRGQKACSTRCGNRIRYWENPEFYRDKNKHTRLKTAEAYRTRGRITWAEAREFRGTEAARYKKFRRPWGLLLPGVKIRAEKNNIPCDLTDEWCEARWTGLCELTKLPFIFNTAGRTIFSPSIDRIDAAKGYTQDNCRFVLWGINAFKSNATDADMIRVAKALIEHNP